ncbi:MAG: hypothetical protein IT359_19740 [Gemmatimonadaceae bacterium]|nr:hypothetical protein [Gemmatimonadaceae bacterium]
MDARVTVSWSIGGAPGDTTFLLPQAIAATTHHFVVYDAVARNLTALDPVTGRVAWRFGRAGRGPNEFGGVATVGPRLEGGVNVIDHGNQRLTPVREDGRPGAATDFAVGVNPRGLCELRGAQLRLRGIVDKELERIPAGSTEGVTTALPWPELSMEPPIVRQSKLFTVAAGEACVLTLSFGPRFAILDEAGTRVAGEWVERIPLARAVSPARGSWRMQPGSAYSTASVSSVGDAFAVLFEGTSTLKLRLLDFYSLRNGDYLFSLQLPFAAKYMTYGHGVMLLAGETDEGEPFVRAVRFAPTLEELVKRASTDHPRTRS